MTTPPTLPAALVAAAGLLPRCWFEPDGTTMQLRWLVIGHHADEYFARDDALLDLSDPQTAFGLALQLDAWEGRHEWARRYADEFSGPTFDGFVARMAARVTHIGMCAQICERLEVALDPGVLPTLEYVDGPDIWKLMIGPRALAIYCIHPEAAPGRIGWYPAPWLAGITDSAAVFDAIHATLTESP